MEIDNCAQVDCFFGTPEVILRPRQRIGGDGMPDLDTPGLSMIKDKSYATLSPGSARRKPFHDITNSSLQAASPGSLDGSLLLSMPKNKYRAQELSSMSTPIRPGAQCLGPDMPSSENKNVDELKPQGSLYQRIIQQATFGGHLLPRTPVSRKSCGVRPQPASSTAPQASSSDPSSQKQLKGGALSSQNQHDADDGNEVTAANTARKSPMFGIGPMFSFWGSAESPGIVLETKSKSAVFISSPLSESVSPTDETVVKDESEEHSSACEDVTQEESTVTSEVLPPPSPPPPPVSSEHLLLLEKEIVKERKLRSELQQKLLKSIEDVYVNPPPPPHPQPQPAPTPTQSHRADGARACVLVDATEEEAQPLPHGAEQQEDAGQGGGGAGDRYMAGGTAHAKELDWLRTQLETQDRVIDMLCKKIPCKDVIETLSSSGLHKRSLLHAAIEEESLASSPASSPSVLPSCPETTPCAGPYHTSFDAVESLRSTAFGLADTGLGARALDNVGAAPACHSVNLSREEEEDVAAVESAQCSLEDAKSSLDRVLQATSLPRRVHATPATPTPVVPRLQLPCAQLHCQATPEERVCASGASRVASLSPDLSALTTVVRLAKEVQAMRQEKHEGEQSMQRAVEQVQARCSRLQQEKSHLSASFQRLTDSLSHSLQGGGGCMTPRGSALARLLEEARMELNQMQDLKHDESPPSLDGDAKPALAGSAEHVADSSEEEDEEEDEEKGEGEDDARGSSTDEQQDLSESQTTDWYQSWYEPTLVGDESLASSLSASLLNASTRVHVHGSKACERDDPATEPHQLSVMQAPQDLSASVWQVRTVSCEGAGSPVSARLRSEIGLAEGGVEMPGALAIQESRPKGGVARSWVRTVGGVVAAWVGTAVWFVVCTCLQLLALAILVIGLLFVVHKRQLVGVV